MGRWKLRAPFDLAAHTLFQDMDGVLACFDWHAIMDTSSRKRDILYEYVKRAVRCLWEDVHARAGLARSTRDAYGNLREPIRVDLKSPARLVPMRLYADFSSKCDSSTDGLGPQTIKQELRASVNGHNDAVAAVTNSSATGPSSALCAPKVGAAIPGDENSDEKTLDEDTNEPSAHQQVPPLQDYCVLRVFASWPPPPADCEVSLQLSWWGLHRRPAASYVYHLKPFAGTKNLSQS